MTSTTIERHDESDKIGMVDIYITNKIDVVEIEAYFFVADKQQKMVIEYTPSSLSETAPEYWEKVLGRDIESRFERGEFEPTGKTREDV